MPYILNVSFLKLGDIILRYVSKSILEAQNEQEYKVSTPMLVKQKTLMD